MGKYDRDFMKDILRSESIEDNYGDEDTVFDDSGMSDEDMLNKLSEYGYGDDDLNDIYSSWSSISGTDVDGDNNIDAVEKDVDGDGDSDISEVKSGKGSRKAKEYEESENDEDKHALDSTGTISDTDDDDWDDVKGALSNLKGY